MVDEKIINSLTSQKTRSQTQTVGLDIQEDITKVLEKRATPAIPVEYKEFKKLFQEELGLDALPKH
jgi:hypothetical protein